MLERIAKLCTKHGFAFPVECRVNGSLLTCYDFGHMGAAFSGNLLKEWWDSVVSNKESIYPVSTSTLTSCPDSVPIGMDREKPLFLPPSLSKGTVLWYPYVLNEMNHRLPFGIVQSGKCFTRENIDQSKFIYQSSEFTQLLLQFFVSPKDTSKWFDYWVQQRLNWWRSFSTYPPNFIAAEEEENKDVHQQQICIKFAFPWGLDNVETITVKGEEPIRELDTSSQVTTGKKSVVPQLIESSTVLEQAMLAYLVDSYEEVVKNSDTKEMKKVFHLHPRIAPYKVAVAIVHSQGHSALELREVADYVSQLMSESGIMVLQLKESSFDSIHSKIDETGVPYCVIIDEKTLINGVISLRSRDTALQDHVHLSGVSSSLVKILESY